MKSKKGISPLIATVLLIGFTIVLAALVIRWGGDFFKGTTEQTGCESEAQTKCVSNIDLEITNVDDATSGELTITVLNNGNSGVTDIKCIAVKEDGSSASSDSTTATPINAFESDDCIVDGLGTDTVKTIKVVPILEHTTTSGTKCTIYCSEITQAGTWPAP